MRLEATAAYEALRVENASLRSANLRLADDIEARAREGAQSGVRATLDERNRTVAAIEGQLNALRAEHVREQENVLATLEERTAAVATLEAQLGSVQVTAAARRPSSRPCLSSSLAPCLSSSLAPCLSSSRFRMLSVRVLSAFAVRAPSPLMCVHACVRACVRACACVWHHRAS